MKKVRKLAVVAVLVAVLVGLLSVPAFAYNNTQIGTSPYQTVTDLSSYFGRGYEGNQTMEMYTLCIDVVSLCGVYVSEGAETASSSCYFDYEIETTADIVHVNIDFFDVTVLTDTAISIYVNDNAIIDMTLQEVQSAGGDNHDTFVLVPFSVWDGVPIIDSGWIAPNPPYQIFNNNQLSNSGNISTGYGIGRQVGIQEGYENGYSAGVADGSTEEETSAVIRLVKAVIEAPFYSISHAFDFTVFGINFANLIMGILSLLIAFFVIRFVVRFFV